MGNGHEPTNPPNKPGTGTGTGTSNPYGPDVCKQVTAAHINAICNAPRRDVRPIRGEALFPSVRVGILFLFLDFAQRLQRVFVGRVKLQRAAPKASCWAIVGTFARSAGIASGRLAARNPGLAYRKSRAEPTFLT